MAEDALVSKVTFCTSYQFVLVANQHPRTVTPQLRFLLAITPLCHGDNLLGDVVVQFAGSYLLSWLASASPSPSKPLINQ
jgi:hypothetical protein